MDWWKRCCSPCAYLVALFLEGEDELFDLVKIGDSFFSLLFEGFQGSKDDAQGTIVVIFVHVDYFRFCNLFDCSNEI